MSPPGTANFLTHAAPTGTDITQPIQRMPPTWQSKYPIYYAFAAVSTVSGLQSWQVLATLAAALLGMAAAGFFVVARHVFRIPAAWAVAAMALAGLDREALHTILNPYFNQTWGFFALPFTLALGWWLVQPGMGRRARGACAVLLAIFGLVLVFAYPLAAPIPAVPIAIFVVLEWRRKLRAGEPTVRPRDLYRGRLSLLWLIPLVALLAVPAIGVGQKVYTAAEVLAPGHSLQSWGGDLPGFIPFNYFVSLPSPVWLVPVVVVVFALAALGLARSPRSLAWGLGGLVAIGVLLAVYLRHRQYGYYFHFKLLAFIGPLVMAVAAVGAYRLRRWGLPLLAMLGVATAGSAIAELDATGYQLPPATIALSGWAASVPRGASIRLDMWPPLQLWAAYFLHDRPLCSQLPLLNTDYPHVPVSRKADYIVATRDAGRPADAIGPALRENAGYRLYREKPGVSGPSACSATAPGPHLQRDRLQPAMTSVTLGDTRVPRCLRVGHSIVKAGSPAGRAPGAPGADALGHGRARRPGPRGRAGGRPRLTRSDPARADRLRRRPGRTARRAARSRPASTSTSRPSATSGRWSRRSTPRA